MRYFPIGLDISGRDALVAGATGEVVFKVARLLDAGANVLVVTAGPLDPQIETWVADGRVKLERRDACIDDMDGKAVVFVATNEAHLAPPFHARALAEMRLVCTLDRPELSTFANPAVVNTSGLTMTFASGGTAPGVMKRIREDLEAVFGDPRFQRFMDALSRLRSSLPRGERTQKMGEAIQGFGIDASLRFPEWIDRQDPS